MNKISLCLLFASIFSIQSADSVKCPKFTHAIPAWADQDIAVKHLKKQYAERFNCTKDEVEIIKSEKDASERKSLQDNPIIKGLIDVHRKRLAGMPHVHKLHQIEAPYGPKMYSEAIVRVLECGKLCERKNEIIRAGEEFVALYNQFE